jgi:hypothetical protein
MFIAVLVDALHKTVITTNIQVMGIEPIQHIVMVA